METNSSRPIVPGLTIMFVDDDAAIRSLGRDMLQALGYKIITAESGAEALALYREYQEEIGLVFTDMAMPQMSGRDLLLALQDIDPEVKVVLITGFSTDKQRENLLGAGFLRIIQKPFRFYDIVEVVEDVLGAQDQQTDPGKNDST